MRDLRDGDHTLMEMQFIENTNANGFGDRESFKLTDKAKKELLEELDIKQKQGKSKKGLLVSGSLTEKKLFYNDKEAEKIRELTALLKQENFKAVKERLSMNGMRNGFACLFYGAPGTGKTETVYQIARETGRNIMPVDISETKSMWFGESEKKIKEVFDRYKSAVEASDAAGELAPILLFNEADAVIGKRLNLGTERNGPAQTENAIQNIILQEIENLTGILIATTNLTQNLDKAFERRFLYKIEFEKPDLSARKSIWQSIIPALSDTDAGVLASRYDFSGGQIENIARKRTVDNIISGSEPGLDSLLSYCKDESLVKTDPRVGFTV
jgi:SpoVK/Ycf46/Vps4 family AAA+-type ATPase